MWEPRAMNTVKTAILLAALAALFGIVGYGLGGQSGLLVGLLVAAGTNLYAWWNSDRLALRAHGAREVDARTAPDLVALVHDLARRADLPPPRVYVIDSPQPNAFATGRNPQNAAVAATTGLLSMLTRDEIAGVMAHELAHVKNRDTLIMTVSATLAGALTTIAQVNLLFGGRSENRNPLALLAMAILGPIAAMILQSAISIRREFEADRIGGTIAGDPLALASALQKISAGVARIPAPRAEARPATAPLFIVNPLRRQALAGLFATHPPVEERIAALQALARSMNAGGRGPSAGAPWGRTSGPWG